MPIHTVIREKRKALELTQEQVAERLGVSASAVNKWERGNTCPDIMILPALARLLETDVNTLLCFKEELTDQEIARVCEDVVKEIKDSGFGAGFCLAARILEGKILGDINEVHLTLMKLLDIVMDEGDEEDAQKIAKIGQKTAELYELWGYNSILIPMELAVKKQDVRESVKYIREMLNIAKAPWKMPDSPLYRHIDKNDKTEEQGGAESRERQDAKEQYGTRILPVLKKELQTSPRYDFLREDEEFLELIAE